MMKNARTSVVGNFKAINVVFASIFQVGDNVAVTPKSDILAVQRQVSTFQENEGNLGQFAIFKRPIPEVPLTEDFQLNIHNESPAIQVDNIKIFGLSIASVFQIGSCRMIAPESRIKHIRQLLAGAEGGQASEETSS